MSRRLATPVLFSVILMVPSQAYERLCFSWEFPVFLHALHCLDISLTDETCAVAVPAPTARPHSYLESSPARRGRLAQSQAGNSVSSGCSQHAATWDQSGQLSPP
jgi:hypothetical protein